jgi:hypothetical protein
MRSALLALIGATVVTGLAPPATAQTVGDRADARCMLVMTLAARDPKNKEAAGEATFYYLGKLTGHGMSAKLAPIMLAEGKTITNAAQAQAELVRCGQEMNTRSGELRATMMQLQQAAQAANPAPAASPAPRPTPPPPKK